MSTVALQIFTGAYPSIANDLTINIYAETDPLAIVATQTHPGPGPHPADTWSFPGLDRVNYLFRIFETSGGTILQQLAGDMYVVPASIGGVASRATEQIEADVTVGFTSGVNVVTFDGTSGSEDWRGWEIGTLNRMGATGDMKKGTGLDYTWNKVTGQLLLQQADDTFGANEWFNVEFEDQITDTSASVPVNLPPFIPKIKTENYTISAGDFGSGLIADPAGDYLEFQLPDIATVVAGRILHIEFRRSATNKCAKMLTDAGQIIDWMQGSRNDLYFCPNENFSLYKFIDPSGPTSEWRVRQPFGNWLKVGDQVGDDQEPANVFNKILLDGASLDSLKYARLYNDYVLLLPGSQVCNYDDWPTGNNKFLFSLANSSDPANAGQFRIPDRRNMFERITDGTRLPGDYKADVIIDHAHKQVRGDGYSGSSQAAFNVVAGGQFSHLQTDSLSKGIVNTIGGAMAVGTETYPKHIAVRKYLYV